MGAGASKNVWEPVKNTDLIALKHLIEEKADIEQRDDKGNAMKKRKFHDKDGDDSLMKVHEDNNGARLMKF
eukprot:jgi/Bigna1/133884/aug1.23_g8592